MRCLPLAVLVRLVIKFRVELAAIALVIEVLADTMLALLWTAHLASQIPLQLFEL